MVAFQLVELFETVNTKRLHNKAKLDPVHFNTQFLIYIHYYHYKSFKLFNFL